MRRTVHAAAGLSCYWGSKCLEFPTLCDGECGKEQSVVVKTTDWEDPEGWFNLTIESDTRVLPAIVDSLADAISGLEGNPELQKLQNAYLATAQQKFQSTFHLCPDCFSGLGRVAQEFLKRQQVREYLPDAEAFSPAPPGVYLQSVSQEDGEDVDPDEDIEDDADSDEVIEAAPCLT